jgi:hypothetical protein
MKAAVNLKRAQYNEVKFSCGQKNCGQKQCLILNGFAIILLNRTFVYSKTSEEKSIDFSLLLFIVITRRYNSSELLLTLLPLPPSGQRALLKCQRSGRV